MSAITSTFSNFVQGILYRGREGHYAYILHRISGLAILAFLALHIVDTSWVYFAPAAYLEAIHLYGSVPFLISEYALFAAIIYHGINGLNIILKDTFPQWWSKHDQPGSFWRVIALSFLFWLPAAFFVSRTLYLEYICHCAPETPAIRDYNLATLVIPIVFIVVLGVLAYGGTFSTAATGQAPRYVSRPGKNFETWSWLFMRWSGGLLVPLVWMHVLANALFTGAHYITLDYVAARWADGFQRGAIFTILIFAFAHGMNGLRAVVNDYLHNETANKIANGVIFVAWATITLIGAIAVIQGVRTV